MNESKFSGSAGKLAAPSRELYEIMFDVVIFQMIL
jgi:hypothetical protein